MHYPHTDAYRPAEGIDRRTFMKLAGGAGAAGVLGVPAIEPAAAVATSPDDISKEEALSDVEYDLEHPRVYMKPDQLEMARWNVQNTQWGADLLTQLRELADYMPKFLFELYFDPGHIPSKPFMEMSDEEIASLAPVARPDGQILYGFPWPGRNSPENFVRSPVDGSDLVPAGMEKPGVVKDGAGREFPGTYDGIEVSDDGGGWVAPDDVPESWAVDPGERVYTTAVYNGYITRVMLNALSPIARTYALTGEQEYARVAARLLDVLATACPDSVNNDLFKESTSVFYRRGYTAGRVLRDFVDATDLIWNSGELGVASPTNAGTSIEENVAENLIVETADFCWRDMFEGYPEPGVIVPDDYEKAPYHRIYHNGTADYQEALVLASSLLGLDVGWAEWSLEGQVSLQNFLANTVYRDGQYYEIGYSDSYLAWADLSYLLRNETYPDGYDIYDNARFQNLNVSGPRRLGIAGRHPKFGDVHTAGGDAGGIGYDTSPKRGDFDSVVQFYARADSTEERDRYAQILAEISGGDPNDQLLANVNDEMGYWEVRGRTWPLFNVREGIDGFDLDDLEIENRDSELLDGKGLAMLRPEEGHDRGAMVRYGASLSHTHADELGLWVYGGGREMSYDPGRNPKAQMMFSFWRQTVAHNTAVVNEWSSISVEDDGGSVRTFADRDGYTLADVENDQSYAHEDVDTYRRATAMLDLDDEHSYFVDLFRVDGPGKEVVDYSFHGQGVAFDTDLDLSDPAPGSVGSEEYFWGDKVDDGGYIDGYRDEGWGFNAPPGNGYGFLGSPRSADGSDTWSASWALDGDREHPAKIKLTMLGDDDHDVVVADAPDKMVEFLGYDPEERTLPYTLTRDESDGPTQYAGVVEAVGEDDYQVDSVEELPVDEWDGEGFEPVAMSVALGDGRTDYVLSVLDGQATAKPAKNANFTGDAEFAHVRRDADGVSELRVERGTHVHAKFPGERPFVVDADEAAFGGEVLAVDYEAPSLLVAGELPAGDQLAGQYVTLDHEEYSHNSSFLVESVAREGGDSRVLLEDTAFDMARGTVGSKPSPDEINSPTLFPLANTHERYVEGGDANEFFEGRRIRNLRTGEETTVVDVRGDIRTVEVADGSVFDVRDNFAILEFKEGDSAEVPLSVEISREDGEYVVDAPEGVDVTTP